MLFWKKTNKHIKEEKKNDVAFEKILQILKASEVEITKLKAEVEQINGKLRKRIYKRDDKDDEDTSGKSGDNETEARDPFDNIRKEFGRETLINNRIGL